MLSTDADDKTGETQLCSYFEEFFCFVLLLLILDFVCSSFSGCFLCKVMLFICDFS